MMTDAPALLGLVVAALGGAAVGVERQRSGHASGEQARFGGVRTFTLLGGVAGLAGWLTTLHLVGLAVVLASGAVALVIERALEARRLRIDNRRLTAEQTLGRRIIGASRPMRRLLEALIARPANHQGEAA